MEAAELRGHAAGAGGQAEREGTGKRRSCEVIRLGAGHGRKERAPGSGGAARSCGGAAESRGGACRRTGGKRGCRDPPAPREGIKGKNAK